MPCLSKEGLSTRPMGRTSHFRSAVVGVRGRRLPLLLLVVGVVVVAAVEGASAEVRTGDGMMILLIILLLMLMLHLPLSLFSWSFMRAGSEASGLLFLMVASIMCSSGVVNNLD